MSINALKTYVYRMEHKLTFTQKYITVRHRLVGNMTAPQITREALVASWQFLICSASHWERLASSFEQGSKRYFEAQLETFQEKIDLIIYLILP